MAFRLLFASLGFATSVRVSVTQHGQESGSCSPPLQSLGGKGCFYKCESDLVMPIAAPSKKGLALDDTTLHWCPENALFHWPNTDEPVTSFRMFKAWASWWNEPWTSKEKAWRALANQLEATGGKVLIGTQISCNRTEDNEDWENVKAMAKIFGPERLMGLAIGNELELLWTKESVLDRKLLGCLHRMWNMEYFLKTFHSRVREFDELRSGFNKVKVTSVFGGFILAEPGYPFYEHEIKARITTFLRNATSVFGDRYAHTVNIYPYFEDNFVAYDNNPNGERKTCNEALNFAKCFAAEDPDYCNFPWMVNRIRERLEALGNADATLWVGETGWSYPKAATLGTKMESCDDWSTQESFTEFYHNFLDWDLSLTGKYRGPDHVFYFTMRDSQNFGKVEGFGLVGDGDRLQWCTNATCKIQKSSMPSMRSTRVGKGYLEKIAALPPSPISAFSVGDMVEILPSTRLSRRCKQFVGKNGEVWTVDERSVWRYEVEMPDGTICWMHKDDVKVVSER